MRKFMCMHSFPPGMFTEEQIRQLADAAQHDPNVRGYRSFFNLSEGKACCVLEADEHETVRSWFGKMNIPYDSIVPLEFEGEQGSIESRELAMAGSR